MILKGYPIIPHKTPGIKCSTYLRFYFSKKYMETAMKAQIRFFFMTLAGILFIAGCGGGDGSSSLVSSDDTAETAPITPNLDIQITAVDDTLSVDEDSSATIDVTKNDKNLDLQNVIVTIDSLASYGTLTLNGSEITYIPNPDFSGEDSLTYRLHSDNGDEDAANLLITVDPVADQPTALTDLIEPDETGIAEVSVLANDLAADEESTLFISGYTNGQYGTVTETTAIDPASVDTNMLTIETLASMTELGGALPTLRYTANPGFSGLDHFTYTISDGTHTDTATVTVRTNATNDPPQANPDHVRINEDTPVTIPVLINDTDPESDALSVISHTLAEHGNVTQNADGTLTYEPDANYRGMDRFSYTVSDGTSTANTSVILTVIGVNDAPVAHDDIVNLGQSDSILVDVLVNDSDIDGHALSLSGLGEADFGTCTIDDNRIRYTPGSDFSGTDQVSYQISDGHGGSATGLLEIVARSSNSAPVAINDYRSTAEDAPIVISVLNNDTDADIEDILTATLLSQPENGTATVKGSSIEYQPDAGFNGVDQFSYVASDGALESTEALVVIEVTAVNAVPVVENDAFTLDEDGALLMDVLGNDSDPDGDALTIDPVPGVGYTHGANGTVTFESGQLRYSPAADFNGEDRFTYFVEDGYGGSAKGSVSLTIAPVNDAPQANDDRSGAVTEDGSILIAVLANDRDIDNDALKIEAFTQASHGEVTREDNQLRYAPNANFNGTDSFSYTITDGNLVSSSATVTVAVDAVNDVPLANDDTLTVAEDSTDNPVSPLANDTDVDGDPLSLVDFTQGLSGSVDQEGNHLLYTPYENYTGVDSFSYTVTDEQGGEAIGTINVTVSGTQDAPVAADDAVTVEEDASVLVTVLSNDVDPDGDSLTITGFTQGTTGSVAQEETALRYTPNPDTHGEDSFTYDIEDPEGNTATATVTVTVTPVNDIPELQSDSVTVDENSDLLVDVLLNDSDIDGDALTIDSFTQATAGSVAQEGEALRYTPNADYVGADTFAYTAADGAGATATAVVFVDVQQVTEPPVAADDSLTIEEDSTGTSVSVLDNDTDDDSAALTLQSFTNGAHGTVIQDGETLVYTPQADFNGADSFTYVVVDEADNTDTATVTVTVTPVNDAPVALADSLTVAEDGSGLATVLDNDSDVDGDPLSIMSVSNASNGSVSFSATEIQYTPDSNFSGSDSLTYTLSDGQGETATATVSITVTPESDAPVAVDDSLTLNEDGSSLLAVLANDSDADGDSLSLTGFTQGSNGTVTQEGSQLRYTPNADFNGSDSFTYTVTDGNGGTASATVLVTISAINDAPVATDDTASVDEDGTVLIDVMSNDLDVDGDSLEFWIIAPATAASHGEIAFVGDQIEYTPDADFSGSDSFTYTINDAQGVTATATVTVTVNPVNDDPTAVDDTAVVDEDGQVIIDMLANDSDIDGDSVRHPSTLTFIDTPHGTVTGSIDGFVYEPDTDFNGTDVFSYPIEDGNGGTATGTVTVTVTPVNDDPVAADATAMVDEDGTVLVDVLSNDSDPEGDVLNISQFTLGVNGTVAQEGNQLRYTPDADFNGSDSFTYTIEDGNGGTATATVSVTINPINDSPDANADAISVLEDSTILFDPLANDSDVDGDIISITGFTSGNDGTVTQEGNSLRYTPDNNFNGTDSFTYDLSDGQGGVSTATVSVTVESVNDAPIAMNDSATLLQGDYVIIEVLANDSDIDNDPLTITSFTQGTNGGVTPNGDSLLYNPHEQFVGDDFFTYTIDDGNGGAHVGTVNVTVETASLLSMDIYEPGGTTGYIELVIPEPGNYQIATSFYQQAADTIVSLYDSSYVMIDSNDDYVDLYGVIADTTLAAGTYYVQVDDWDGFELYTHLEVTKL